MARPCDPSFLVRCGLVTVLVGSACGDDGPSQSSDSDSEGTTEAASGSSGPAVDGTTSDETTAGMASSSTAADESSSSGPPPPLELEVEVFTYPNQPMVADLAFSAPDLTVSVEHTIDPGVRFGAVEGEDGQTWVRLRGLAPDTMHELAWSAEAPSGSTGSGEVVVQTEPALPGWLPGFFVEGSGGYGGYVLFDLLALTPDAPASLFVIDTQGATRWHIGRSDGVIGPPSVFAGAKLRPDGTLLYLRDYSLYVIDEMGVALVELSSADLGLPGLHHDVIELDNGNFLSMSYTFRDIEYPDIGLTHVAGDLLVEITPDGEIVWEWDSFDHLDPQRRRDGFDDVILDPATLENGQDWTHGNGVVYDAATDTVLFSMRHQDWIVQIDRATGDVLWRLGSEGDFELLAGSWQHHQHSPEWQADGTLLLYDNGNANPDLPDAEETSRAVRYALDTEVMTATQVWEDEAEDFLSIIAGDADRLPDGSILVTDSAIDLHLGPQAIHARVREIDEDSSDVPQWSFTTALGNFIYRCTASDRLPGETP